MSQAPVLIIGGAGKTGARVNQLLQAQGIATRPVSRSSAIAFDWLQPQGWAAALAGVSKAYVTFQPDLAVEGSTEAITELARLAREQGLEHVVLLSGRGEPGAQRAEAALAASGLTWTVVRASWFNQNFSEGYLRDGVVAGEIALPAGDVREPFVDTDDIAEVAVAALTGAAAPNRVYEVTGPHALTFAEAVAEIAPGLGRPLNYRQISYAEFEVQLRAQQVPEDIVALMQELFTVVLDGRNNAVTHGVEQALGRPARDFSTFVRDAVAAGAW
jgi:uncharacterized protein YbjT (DUF2867 family)